MQTVISNEWNGLRYKYFKNDCLASSSIALNTEWEPHITMFTKLYNERYSIKNIIDIGANFGYHTILFSRECSVKVHAFEPQKQNFELLKDNVSINNLTNVVVYNYACGDEECDIKMPIFDSEGQINMGDVTPNLQCANNYSTCRSIVLDTMTFESNVDLIKIDVQGWEKKVLLGASTLLKTHKPALIVEFEEFQLRKTHTSCKELFDYIRGQNYYIFFLEYSYPSDHICVHNDNVEEFRLRFKNHIFPHTQNNHINNNVMYGVNEKIVVV